MGFDFPGTDFGAYTTTNLTPPTTGSICFWIRPQNLGGVQRVCATADNFECRFENALLINDYAITGTSVINFGTFSNGTLYHCVATWNVSSTAGQAYRDGSLVSSASDRNGVTAGLFTLSGRNGIGQYFEGELYDIRIYNRILSANEILTIYNSKGMDSIVYGMIHRWMMNEQSPGIAFSGSGAAKDIGANQLNLTAYTGPPAYIYDASLSGRRRMV